MPNNQLLNIFTKLNIFFEKKSLYLKPLGMLKNLHGYRLLGVVLVFSFLSSASFFLITNYSIGKDESIGLSEQKSQILGVQSNLLEEEAFWQEFLSKHPNYFSGWLRLAQIEGDLNKESDRDYALQKAEEVDPNFTKLNKLP